MHSMASRAVGQCPGVAQVQVKMGGAAAAGRPPRAGGAGATLTRQPAAAPRPADLIPEVRAHDRGVLGQGRGRQVDGGREPGAGAAADGATVGIIDADVYGPDVPLMLGAQRASPGMFENRIIPVEAHGIKMMSIGLLVNEREPLVWRGPMIHSFIQQMLQGRELGRARLPRLRHAARHRRRAALALAGDAAQRRGDGDDAAGRGAARRAQGASACSSELNVPILGVVENMSYFVVPALRPAHAHLRRGRRPAGGRRVRRAAARRRSRSIPRRAWAATRARRSRVAPARLGAGARRSASWRAAVDARGSTTLAALELPAEDQLTRRAWRHRRRSLPIFPLPDVTFFPHTLLPLHVFEARYRAMVTDALARDRRLAVVQAPARLRGELRGQAGRHAVAGVGRDRAAASGWRPAASTSCSGARGACGSSASCRATRSIAWCAAEPLERRRADRRRRRRSPARIRDALPAAARRARPPGRPARHRAGRGPGRRRDRRPGRGRRAARRRRCARRCWRRSTSSARARARSRGGARGARERAHGRARRVRRRPARWRCSRWLAARCSAPRRSGARAGRGSACASATCPSRRWTSSSSATASARASAS